MARGAPLRLHTALEDRFLSRARLAPLLVACPIPAVDHDAALAATPPLATALASPALVTAARLLPPSALGLLTPPALGQ